MSQITNQNNEDSFTFNDQQQDSLFLSGLKEDEYCMSEQPYYYQDENGLMVGIDNSYTTFLIIKGEQVIQTIQVQWNKENNDQHIFNHIENNDTNFFLYGLLFITLLVVLGTKKICKNV